MRFNAKKCILIGWVLAGVSLLFLTGCGNSGGVFTMEVASTIFVGDPLSATPSPTPSQNPEQQEANGTLEAQVSDTFANRSELEISSFDMSADFAGVGTIHFVLDPHFTSTATVFKLDCNNKPLGVNTMDLSLIVETPDQNLTYTHIDLESPTAILALAQNLPTLNFFVQGQPKQLDLSALLVTIPSQLISSECDQQ
jgi:hypothetical protein